MPMLTTLTHRVSLAIGILAFGGQVSAQGVAPGSLQEKAVKKELRLTDDQSKKVDAFFAELDAKEREARQKFAQATEAEGRKMMEEMRESSIKQLNAILKPEQFKRLQQIEVQRGGFSVFGSPKIQADLKLTDEQKAKVGQIVGDAMGKIRQSGMELQADAKAATRRREEISKEALAQVVAVLTPAQQADWKDMTGAPFDAPREAPTRRIAGAGGPPPTPRAELKNIPEEPKARVARKNLAPLARRPAPTESELPDGLVGLPETFFGGNRDRFTDIAPDGGMLVGVSVSYITRFGGPKISSVVPIYRVGEKLVDGKRHGKLLGKETKAVAKPGYAVGAVKTHTGLTVDGFEMVFMKVDGDRLDASDAYNSPWLGDVKGGSPRDVSSDGKIPVGLQGRSGQEVNALGLIVGK
jgi:hypothetical protein